MLIIVILLRNIFFFSYLSLHLVCLLLWQCSLREKNHSEIFRELSCCWKTTVEKWVEKLRTMGKRIREALLNFKSKSWAHFGFYNSDRTNTVDKHYTIGKNCLIKVQHNEHTTCKAFVYVSKGYQYYQVYSWVYLQGPLSIQNGAK